MKLKHSYGLIVILFIITISFSSAYTNEFYQICGGDDEFEILCSPILYSSESNATTPVTPVTPSGGGGGGEVPSGTNVVIIGENDTSYSSIDLDKLIIDTNLLCLGDNKLNFRSLDDNDTLTLVDSSKIIINDKLRVQNVVLDLTNKTYYYDLSFNETGEYNITISVNQKGKELNESKKYQVKECNSIQKTASTLWEKIRVWYYNNRIYINWICLLILLLIIFLVIAKATKKKR